MMKQRALKLVGLALLWLVVANATCDTERNQADLLSSYQLARFHLNECQAMGAESLNPENVANAMRLDGKIAKMLENGNWSEASESIGQMEQIVTLLFDELNNWDPDGDELSNYAEFMLYGTSWSEVDSDGDGYFDGSEILLYQTDPLDHCAVPIGEPIETMIKQDCPLLERLK
ncbi:MAG: hypothetical protein PVI17_01715 [Syntrophobacterales bacterium]|jgi:hypothetical protein